MKFHVFILLFTSPIWAKPNHRIIGGEVAAAGEFPYAAAIHKTTPNGKYFCAGALLALQWVITAGQCVYGATMLEILLGTNDLEGEGYYVQRVTTSTYYAYPDFDPVTLAHDIGLIKFKEKIWTSMYVAMLGLPLVDVSPDMAIETYGWGQTSDDNSNLSDELRYVKLTSISDAECKITYGSQLVENMVCFEGNYNEGTCFGDSGSPAVQRPGPGFPMILAVASFFSANGCESTDPSGYTRVYPYNDWIRNITANG